MWHPLDTPMDRLQHSNQHWCAHDKHEAGDHLRKLGHWRVTTAARTGSCGVVLAESVWTGGNRILDYPTVADLSSKCGPAFAAVDGQFGFLAPLFKWLK